MGSTTKLEMDSTAETVTFGRTLVDGEPIDDGLTFPKDSPTVELLATATTPLFSNPQLGEYGAGLVTPEETDGAYTRGLGIFPPGADGPAEHVHPNYDETFEVVEGEFVIQLPGESRTLTAGESVTVETGTPHAFRNESESYASCIIEARPAGRLGDVIALLFGLAHDGKLTESGRPSFLQAMVMADEMGDDTVFTSPPPVVQNVLATVFSPIGRLLGYRATYPEYEDEAFWNARVEQLPDLS
ncbi:cupin domain-containing protein [Halocatena marina]|uniref:Cupin domain-containing protein n=1 Tax=Halocatena marina TaxID=2934937 RepID=A0ABD5YYG1_9EURY|nr:cupin domain-containing protein [Halocatena marina]